MEVSELTVYGWSCAAGVEVLETVTISGTVAALEGLMQLSEVDYFIFLFFLH